MPYVIGEPCVDVMDKSCIEDCPVDCIYEGERMLYIHPSECIDCGACESACPMGAIVSIKKADERWDLFREATREVVEQIGTPGGSYEYAEAIQDPSIVANLPRKL